MLIGIDIAGICLVLVVSSGSWLGTSDAVSERAFINLR